MANKKTSQNKIVNTKIKNNNIQPIEKNQNMKIQPNINNTTFENIYYFNTIYNIGGVETFLYQLALKYSMKDLTIIYNKADPQQLNRLKKYVKCIQYTGQKIKCKKAFFNYSKDIINNVDAKEYIEIIHADYYTQKITPLLDNKITKAIGVSKHACDAYTKLTGKPCELCYNPYTIPQNIKPIIKLISATRLTKEKGYDRMVKLAQALDKKNIPYLWLIFTNTQKSPPSPNIVFMKPTLDLMPYLINSDFLVQLSDCEGYCYSVVEAWTQGIPVITTELPVIKEIGGNENNSITLKFDMSNIDEVINRMLTDNFVFEYTPKEDNWDHYLGNKKSTYIQDNQYLYKVKANNNYEKYKIKDVTLQTIPKTDTEWLVDYNRLLLLLGNNPYKMSFVSCIDKIKKTEENNVK